MSKNRIYEEFEKELRSTLASRESPEVRVGAELKFPMVNPDGTAAGLDKLELLWDYLEEKGWEKEVDPVSGSVSGCRKKGSRNHSVASTETGYAKTEFSLAHEKDLFEVRKSLAGLIEELKGFQSSRGVLFLCHGIHPVSSPCKDLMVKKSRTSVWDQIFKSNNHIPEEDGDDMHLFTVNAASHVHVSAPEKDMVSLVNVLNGFSPAQIALTAHSTVWRGKLDREYKCAAETFWDRWIPEPGRIGVPEQPFTCLEHYVEAVSSFKPVFVKREDRPVLLPDYESFSSYYALDEAAGYDLEGNRVAVRPAPEDIKLHNTLYWFNARISGYYTVENRLNDQQPEDSLLAPSALTLGLAHAVNEAWEELSGISWEKLREARKTACCGGAEDDFSFELAGKMLGAAEAGLKKRGLGEEVFLQPLFRRLKERRCPADDAREIFESGGIEKLLQELKLKGEIDERKSLQAAR